MDRLPVVQWLVENYGGIANIPDSIGELPPQVCRRTGTLSIAALAAPILMLCVCVCLQRGSLLGIADFSVAEWLVDSLGLDVNDVAPVLYCAMIVPLSPSPDLPCADPCVRVQGDTHPLAAACYPNLIDDDTSEYFKWLVEHCGANVRAASGSEEIEVSAFVVCVRCTFC